MIGGVIDPDRDFLNVFVCCIGLAIYVYWWPSIAIVSNISISWVSLSIGVPRGLFYNLNFTKVCYGLSDYLTFKDIGVYSLWYPDS